VARPSLLGLVVCFASLAFAQNAIPNSRAAQASSTPVQVVYVIDGTSLVTYNVDPQTLYATQVGTPLTVGGLTGYGTLFPSPNDHFVYFVSPDAQGIDHLWVYVTDASGVPQAPATQKMTVNGFWGFQLDPRSNFAYLVFKSPNNGSYNATYSIRRYVVDPVSGRLSQALVEATYVLPDDPSGAYCWLGLLGFNPAATTLYDATICANRDNGGGTAFERTLNSQTGALGPDVQIYSWSSGNGGYESVQFVQNLMFDFVAPNGFQQGIDWVNIDPVKPHTKPLVHCTANMLEACGNAGGVAHPSGNYLFMRISPDATQIERVALSRHRVVDTGNYIPYGFGQFSPDGSIVYGILNQTSGYALEIYGFNATTSAVRPGGSIFVPSGLDSYFVAERY
jgi:hypothetical protein